MVVPIEGPGWTGGAGERGPPPTNPGDRERERETESGNRACGGRPVSINFEKCF